MYFITTLKIENQKIIDSRTVGYYSKEKDAIECVKNNYCDLNECGAYNHIVIENIPEGIYNYDFKPQWFEWNKNKNTFCKCSIPEGFESNSTSYSIG